MPPHAPLASPAPAPAPASATTRSGWRLRWRRWWLQRHPLSDAQLLTQRNVYILPTRAGLMFAATLLVLLLASVNYQLSLGYLLTFLLAGCGAVSMHLAHDTLRGLILKLRPPAAVFAGDAVLLDITLSEASGRRNRFGLGVCLCDQGPAAASWIDVPAGAQSQLQVSHRVAHRGWNETPAVRVETRFPFGLFRAWTIWRPASRVLAYPRLESPAAPLPGSTSSTTDSAPSRRSVQGGETSGTRPYRRGDPLKQVLWRQSARQLETGGGLVSRDTHVDLRQDLWLDWQQCAGLAPEERLSRLAAWVEGAQRLGLGHGLSLPGVRIEPASGELHRRRCLEALALWR